MACTDTDPKSFNPSFTREGLMLSLVFVASSDRWPSELGPMPAKPEGKLGFVSGPFGG